MSGPTGIDHLSKVCFLSSPMKESYIAEMIFRSSASSLVTITDIFSTFGSDRPKIIN